MEGKAPRKVFKAADLLKQVMVQEIAVAPEGSAVAYTRRTIADGKYRKDIWMVDAAGGRPERMTRTKDLDARPRFSPDGAKLLFLSNRTGRFQPWILPVAGGEPWQLAEVPGEATAAEWSPDGRRVLIVAGSGDNRFITGKPDDPTARVITDLTWRLDGVGIRDQYNSVWAVAARGGKASRLVPSWFEVAGAFWSPDSATVGFIADLSPEGALEEHNQAWTVPASGGDPAELVVLAGSVLAASWSRAGTLAFVGVDYESTPEWRNPQLFVLDGGKPRVLGGDLDLPVANMSYGDLIDPDSNVSFDWRAESSIVALVSERGRTLPFGFDLDGRAEKLVDGEYICSALAVGGDLTAVVATEGGNAGEVYALEDGSLRRLTNNGSRWLEPFRRDPEHHLIRHPEGHDLDTWLVPARGKRRQRPLVVQIHGGPHASYGPTPFLEMLALADAGIHVVYTNPRGSMGYGERYSGALRGVWGDPDSTDIMAVVDWAIAEGLADPEKIGVLGLSYGGFMVNWLLGHFPDRFFRGVSENPVTDMVAEFAESDFGTQIGETAVGVGTLPENLDAFLKRSPYVEVLKTTAPLLLLHADSDLRCPPGQTELVFTILAVHGHAVEMVRYPDESHYMLGVGRPDRRVDRIVRIVDWFTRPNIFPVLKTRH